MRMASQRIFYWITGIGVLLLVLIAIQFIWLREASQTQERERKMHIVRALEHAEQKLRNTNYCFTMYGKTYITPDESFYIVRQKMGPGNTKANIDTIQLYYDTEGYYPDSVLYSERTFRDPVPVTAEIHLNFTAAISDTNVFYDERKAFFEKRTGKKLRDIITNKRPVETVFNMNVVDSFIAATLKEENIRDSFGFGFVNDKEKSLAYSRRVSDTAGLMRSPYHILLFSDNKFLKPYRLAVLFPDAGVTHAANFWLLLSILVILILILSFCAFIRLYLRQTKLSAMKSDFINNLTHEFNTPMANISLAIESLDNTEPEQHPKLRKMLSIISSESQRLGENIERALQVVIMEKGKLKLRHEDIDLVSLIQTVLTTYQMQTEQLGGSISFIHPSSAMIYGDETHLLNCVCNLLDNAIKYRRNIPIIEIFLEDSGSAFLLTVTDNGQGMSQETQKYIFEKFYRAPQGNLHETKGFGLGLSYVKGIVETHGGSISVHSRKGNGTKFLIKLPKSNEHAANK